MEAELSSGSSSPLPSSPCLFELGSHSRACLDLLQLAAAASPPPSSSLSGLASGNKLGLALGHIDLECRMPSSLETSGSSRCLAATCQKVVTAQPHLS